MKTGSEKLSNFLIINEVKIAAQNSVTALNKCKILLKCHYFTYSTNIFLSLYTLLNTADTVGNELAMV